MQSKRSYFNGTLFKKNLTRYWPLWGLASFGGAIFPLAALINLIRSPQLLNGLEVTTLYYQVLTYAVPLISICYAALCAIAVWNYLYNSRSVSLMHTLPIKREGLFLTGVASGMVMMLIPYVITGGLIVLVTSFFGGFEPVGILVTILGVIGNSLFFFGLATFCAFIVGNVFMLPLLYGLFNFIAVLTDFMVSMLANGFCFGLNSDYTGVVEWLSPVVYLMQTVCPDYTYETQWVQEGYVQHEISVLTGVTLENGWLIAVYAVVGVVLLVLAWMLYRHRRSESAGDVVAVGWMKPVFRYGWAAYSAILGGRLLYALFWENFQSNDYFDVAPLALCMIVGGAIGYYAASMLLAKTPRVFKQTGKGMIAVALGCVALCALMKCDAFGVVRRVPGLESIQRVQIYAADSNYYLTAGQDDALIEEVRALHSAIVDEQTYIISSQYAFEQTTDSGELLATHTYLRLTYTLNNGLEVKRRYYVPLVRQRMEESGTYEDLLNQLINSPEMRQKRIRWQDPNFTIDSAWLHTRTSSPDLSSREVEAILAAVARDAENGNWGVYNWFKDYDEADAYPIEVCIEYRTTNKGSVNIYDSVYITVRESMAETLAVLEELDLISDEDRVTNREAYPWQYIENGWEEYDLFFEQFHMSPEEFYNRYSQYPEGWFDGPFDGDTHQYGGEGEMTEAATYENMGNVSSSVGIIGGADGPTTVFVAGAA